MIIKITLGVLAVLLCYTIWSDLTKHKIKNWAVLTILIGGLSFQFFSGEAGALVNAGKGLLVGFFLFLPAYILGITSAGDVKLMAAIGTYLGAWPTLIAAAATVISGGVYALLLIILKGQLFQTLKRWKSAILAVLYRNKSLYITPEAGEVAGGYFPYALAIATGVVIAVIMEKPFHQFLT